jgi:heptosyltransferase-2
MPDDIRTVLVRCPNWVGDVVAATPAFDCLRENFPKARMIAVIRRYAQGVIESGPWFDAVIGCDDRSQRGFFSLVQKIRRLTPDLAVVLPNSFRSTLSVFLGGARAIYGYRRGVRRLLLSGGPAPVRNQAGIVPRPMTEYYIDICRWLGLSPPADLRPSLFFSDDTARKAAQLLAGWGIQPEDMVIGLNPGAKFGSSKCWPPEYFGALCDRLAATWKCKIVLFAGPGEAPLTSLVTQNTAVPVIDTGPNRIDLALLKPLIRRCQLLITNDTGPRHYAVALGVPVVVLMGPTDPRYTGMNIEKTRVIRQELPCSPCHEKVCPLGHHTCMTAIAPDRVLGVCQQLLREVG